MDEKGGHRNFGKNNPTMQKLPFFLLFLISCCGHLVAQTKTIPMQASAWNFPDTSMRFATYEGVPALHIEGPGEAIAKDLTFSTGTIEFDFHATGPGFCGMYFRRGVGDSEMQPDFFSEFFYLRTFDLDNPLAAGAMQYAPIIRGTNLWDVLHDYEGHANIKSEGWNHLKFVISEKQLKVYLNGEEALWVPELLGRNTSGGLSLGGGGIYANLMVSPGATEGLPDQAGADLTRHDARYLRNWERSPEAPMPLEEFITSESLPDSNTVWTPIRAERGGLVNLTREVSSPFVDQERRIIWLRTTIESKTDQTRKLSLGFSDDVWVFVNSGFTYLDMNMYGNPIQKQPNGRLSLENATFDIDLKAGENEVWIGVANAFFGWGIVARLDSVEGILRLAQTH